MTFHFNDFCRSLKLNALSLNFTICNTLNNRGKWQNLKQENISVERKVIFKKDFIDYLRRECYRRANQWTRFYMITASVMKELSLHFI